MRAFANKTNRSLLLLAAKNFARTLFEGSAQRTTTSVCVSTLPWRAIPTKPTQI